MSKAEVEALQEETVEVGVAACGMFGSWHATERP